MERSASVFIFLGGSAKPSGPEPLWEFLSPCELSRLSTLPARKRRDWESGRMASKHAYACFTAQLKLEPAIQVEAQNGRSGCPQISSAHETGEHVRREGSWRVFS